MGRDSALKRFLKLLQTEVGVDEQVKGMEHYITPHTMSLINKLIRFFTSNPQALDESHNMPDEESPASADLPELRAWEFRHSTDEL